jgi:hypothetical protein
LIAVIETQSKANTAVVPHFFLLASAKDSKKKAATELSEAASKIDLYKNTHKERLVGAHRRLNFRLVNVKVRVDMLHVIVLFQRLDEPHHLRSL